MEKKIQFLPQVRTAINTVDNLVASSQNDNSIEAFRAIYRHMIPMAGIPQMVYQVEDRLIPGPAGILSIRIYRPSPEKDLPVTVFFHGGWFFMGGLDTHDTTLRALANAANCLMVAVDYRLAPEHPFPAAPDDCYAATQWISAHAAELGGDPDRIAVAGDSAGGTLAAAVARRALMENGPKLLFQVLIYPVTSPLLDSASWQEFAEGPLMNRTGAEQAWMNYIPQEEDRLHPDAAPLLPDGWDHRRRGKSH
jgi:acetyl esterase/lipase